MNSVVEKLTAIEHEVAALQPKMAPLTKRIVALDQNVSDFARQLAELTAESAAVKQDIEFTRQSLTRIHTLIGESKAESEQLATEQDENLERYKAMESFVETLYQLHSQSLQIAQWLGLADQAKAVFPAPPHLGSKGITELPMQETSAETIQPEEPPPEQLPEGLPAPPSLDEPDPPMSANEQPTNEYWEAIAETVPPEQLAEGLSAPPSLDEPDPPISANEQPTNEYREAIAETVPPEQPAGGLPLADSILSELSESDFGAVTFEAEEKELASWAVHGLPDVAAPPEVDGVPSDSYTDSEPSSEMASQLDVPPLDLAAPALPEPDVSATIDEQDDQDIEAMLAAMGVPVTVGQE